MTAHRTPAHILHEPTDLPDPQPTPVPHDLYDILANTLGAVIEGPAGDEVVWFNKFAYCKAKS